MYLPKFLKIPGLLIAFLLLMFLSSLMPVLSNVASAAAPTKASDCPAGTRFDDYFQPPRCVDKSTPISDNGLPHTHGAGEKDVKKIVAIVFEIVGALALLMIVISGLRYVLSAGDPQRISKAKDGILYALVGLAIALAAEAIVAFVGGQL
jgi:hypothetical protein